VRYQTTTSSSGGKRGTAGFAGHPKWSDFREMFADEWQPSACLRVAFGL
jgi:hypothetical protein